MRRLFACFVILLAVPLAFVLFLPALAWRVALDLVVHFEDSISR